MTQTGLSLLEIDMNSSGVFVHGGWRPSHRRERVFSFDPSTEQTIGWTQWSVSSDQASPCAVAHGCVSHALTRGVGWGRAAHTYRRLYSDRRWGAAACICPRYSTSRQPADFGGCADSRRPLAGSCQRASSASLSELPELFASIGYLIRGSRHAHATAPR
jgi:hypothetical protein